MEAGRHRLQARQQPAGFGHDRGNRRSGVDLGREHQRPVQERQAARVVAKALGVQAERQGNLDRVAAFSTTGRPPRSFPACSSSASDSPLTLIAKPDSAQEGMPDLEQSDRWAARR